MKNLFSKLAFAGSLALFGGNAMAQMSLPAAFVKGDYVEVGVASTGAFGTCGMPAGYHSNVTQYCGGSSVPVLGFVSDPDKDGWLVSAVGSAAYMGDYFVPGSPYEGWDLQYAGTAYRYRNDASGGTCPGSSCANVSYVATPTEQTTIWEGTNGNLAITQKTVVKKDKLYFVMYVDIVNTGATAVTGLYYFRGLDPDNDQPWPGGNFTTLNKIVYQPNSVSKNCLATAEGLGYPKQAYLGLGTKDCRAKCCIFGSWPYSASLSETYNQNGSASSFYYNVGSTVTSDIAIGLIYNLGTLAPGQKTSLAYTYILKQADLDSALGETAPKFESSGAPYSPYTTFRVCPGKTVPLKVVNGGQYRWIWTPGTYMAASGTGTLIPAGGTVPTVTGTKTYPDGGVYGDSVVVTVWGPKTYTATGISNCDTQYLIFYVDTISFSVPPAVTTPVRYCENETAAALTAGVAAGAKLNWYLDTAAGTPSSGTAPTPSTTFPAGSAADFDTTSFWVSQTNLAGCETPKSKIDVIITRKPAPPVVTPTITYCLGDTVKPLTATGSLLKWYDAATAGTRYASTPTPDNSKAGITTYYVSQTVNGCESDRAAIAVEISQAIASFTKTSDSLCGPELLLLTNTSKTTSAGSYVSNWKFGDGASKSDSNTSHSYADARGTYTIKLHITNFFGCVDSTTQIVEVFPQPEISMTASATKICQGDAVDFKGTATPGFRTLTWDFGDGDPSFNTLDVRHAFTKAGLFPIKLSGTYPACEGVGSGVTVEVVPVPNVNLGKDTGFCPGGQMMTLYNMSTSPVTKYVWNTGDTTASIKVTNAGQYSVRAENWNCYASDSITISKACYLDVPNAFAPGSGTDHDNYFMPRQLLSASIVTFSMQVFDRWGQLIFESDKTNGRGWDGNYKGQAMPMGVYVYIIHVSFANGVSESYNGNVTLTR